MEEIKRIDRVLISEGSCLRYYHDTMVYPNGKHSTWDYVEHKFNAAAVLPVLRDGRILLVCQYRPGRDGLTWEIPAGKRDDDGAEDPAVCAKRELLEETGHDCKSFSFMMRISPAMAYCSETVDIFLAEGCYPAGEQDLDEGESINLRAFSPEEMTSLIEEGKMTDAKTVAAIYGYLAKKNRG